MCVVSYTHTYATITRAHALEHKPLTHTRHSHTYTRKHVSGRSLWPSLSLLRARTHTDKRVRTHAHEYRTRRRARAHAHARTLRGINRLISRSQKTYAIGRRHRSPGPPQTAARNVSRPVTVPLAVYAAGAVARPHTRWRSIARRTSAFTKTTTRHCLYTNGSFPPSFTCPNEHLLLVIKVRWT